MKNFFTNIWEGLVNIYNIYSNFVHSIFPGQLGNLVVGVIDILVVGAIVIYIGKIAFTSKNGEN